LEALLLPPKSLGARALLCLRSASEAIAGASQEIAAAALVEADAIQAGALAQAQVEAPSSCCAGTAEATEEFDCLPPTACVWVQGAETPTQLSDLRPGMRILTMDPLRSPSVSFTSVKKISMEADRLESPNGLIVPQTQAEPGAQTVGETVDWIRVALADGSEVITTASHPMFPEGTSTNSGYTLGALKAEDLVPGVDSLISMSARPVLVKSVTSVPAQETPAGRVQLELGWEQAVGTRSRRTLLMTMPQEPGGPPVGASFVGVCDSLVKPASSRYAALEEDIDTSVSGSADFGSWPSTGSGGFREEVKADGSPKENVEIILGSIDEHSGWRRSRRDGEWYRNEDVDAKRTVRLSDVRNLPRKEDGSLLSYGSIAHAVKNEQCKVCVFQRKTGTICRNGWACTFCHAWHQPYVRPRRPDKRRVKGGSQMGDDDQSQQSIGSDEGYTPMPPQQHLPPAPLPPVVGTAEPWYVQPSSTGLSLSPIAEH